MWVFVVKIRPRALGTATLERSCPRTDTLLGETAESCFGAPTVLRNGAVSIFSASAEMEEKGLELLGGGEQALGARPLCRELPVTPVLFGVLNNERQFTIICSVVDSF